MNNRSKHLPFYSLLIGGLMISIGFNLLFYNRIVILQEYITATNPWINLHQFNLLKQEIDRLENTKYQITPKGE